jgi:hypothetical protein
MIAEGMVRDLLMLLLVGTNDNRQDTYRTSVARERFESTYTPLGHVGCSHAYLSRSKGIAFFCRMSPRKSIVDDSS